MSVNEELAALLLKLAAEIEAAGKLASAGFTAATRVGIDKLIQLYAGT